MAFYQHRHARLEVYSEHDGNVGWSCSACKQTGLAPFEKLRVDGAPGDREARAPNRSAYDQILTTAEVEHATETGCKGRIQLEVVTRHKIVKHEKVW